MMKLGLEECNSLIALLKGVDERSFSDITSEFVSRIRPLFRFAFCSSLVLLLEKDKKFLTSSERLVYIAILYQTSSSLVDAACHDAAEKYARAFILQLIYSHKTCNINEVFPQREQLHQTYCDKNDVLPFNSLLKNIHVKNVIPNPDIPCGCGVNSSELDVIPGVKPKLGSGDRNESVANLLQNMSPKGLGPQWIKPLPPRLPVFSRELEWLTPANGHELLWDSGMCAEVTFKKLIGKALQGSLSFAEQEQVVLKLPADPKTVYNCGLTPEKLPELVKYYPWIAVEVLIKFINSPEVSEYLHYLVKMDVRQHSIEVVNGLITAVELPTEYVHLYITNCISSCRNIEDKLLQHSLVRLVSVFLQSLINKKIVEVQDISIEVQAFCIEFSRFREAMTLYRRLLSFE